jgi:hypothetical protein
VKDDEARRALFRACVAQYLHSELGASTPDPIARRLLRLDPDMIGLVVKPSLALVHGLRAYFEASGLGNAPSGPPPSRRRRKAD